MALGQIVRYYVGRSSLRQIIKVAGPLQPSKKYKDSYLLTVFTRLYVDRGIFFLPF
jgi:hypothetical protein